MAKTSTTSPSKRVARTRKNSRPSVKGRYLVDADGKRVAILLDIDEYRKLVAGPKSKPVSEMRLPAVQRAKLVKLARQAKGSWKQSEGQGTAVEIVRRLRDEWR